MKKRLSVSIYIINCSDGTYYFENYLTVEVEESQSFDEDTPICEHIHMSISHYCLSWSKRVEDLWFL